MAVSRARQLNPLTSIRFIAAAFVIWLHIKVLFYNAGPSYYLSRIKVVSLFFVLSGFILSYIYSSGFPEGRLRFLVARVVRLWPAHVAAIVLMCLVAPGEVAQRLTPGKLAATLSMTNSWLPFEQYWFFVVPPAWTVSTEFGLYFCFLFLIYKWERTWPWKLGGSFLVLCGMILLFEAERARLAHWSLHSWYYILYVHPFARLFEFTLGMATYECWRRAGPKIKNQIVVGTVWEFAALALLLFMVWQSPVWADQVTRLWSFGSELAGFWMLTSSSCIGYAALIFVLAQEQGLMARLLSRPVFVLLGHLSYAIYLVHWPVLVFFSTHRRSFAGMPDWVMFSIIGLLILGLSYLIWATVEKPCRALLGRFWPARANA
jgi:peptidoglycan/LPS O-acetylase OafA/YrhL